MNLFSKIIGVFVLLASCALCISWEVNEGRLYKKVDKQIAKIWKEKTPQRQELQIVTEDYDAENRKYFALMQNDSVVGYAVVCRSYGCRVGGCAVYTASTDKEGSYDPFYYSVITDHNFAIKNIQVLEYYSEYGYQITNKKWLAQFIGTDGKSLEYGKDVDAISGATISVRSLIDDVEIVCTQLQELNAQELSSK